MMLCSGFYFYCGHAHLKIDFSNAMGAITGSKNNFKLQHPIKEY